MGRIPLFLGLCPTSGLFGLWDGRENIEIHIVPTRYLVLRNLTNGQSILYSRIRSLGSPVKQVILRCHAVVGSASALLTVALLEWGKIQISAAIRPVGPSLRYE